MPSWMGEMASNNMNYAVSISRKKISMLFNTILTIYQSMHKQIKTPSTAVV